MPVPVACGATGIFRPIIYDVLRSISALALLVSLPLTAAPSAKDLDAYIQPYLQWNTFSGVILLAKGEEVLLQKAYGMANYEFNVRNTVDTRFRIASITKRFTHLIITKLAQEKKLSPDDPISKWLPDFPSADKITVSHLVSHRSGIRDPERLRRLIPMSMTPDEAIAVIKEQPLESVPGEKYFYTTANYTLLAAILERVTGKNYADVVRETIYTPAGMTDSGELSTAVVVPRLASGYMPNPFGSGVIVCGPEDPSWKTGGGSSYSTARDLHRFFRALYGGKLMPGVEVSLAASTAPGEKGFRIEW